MNDHLEMLTDVTELGNSLLLGVLSLAMAAYLAMIGYRREPVAVLLAFLLPAAIIGFLKIAFYICHVNLWGIVSPSGHAAISIGVFGTSALILSKVCDGIWRAIIPLTLVILAIVIAVSRTVLGMHTDGDVMVGSLIGLIVIILIGKLVLSYRIRYESAGGQSSKKAAHPAIIAVMILFIVGLSYGIKLPSEKMMKLIAKEIRENLAVCN